MAQPTIALAPGAAMWTRLTVDLFASRKPRQNKNESGMNIIIVAKPHAVPQTIDLGCWRTRLKCGAILGCAALACALLGVSVAYSVA